MSPLVLDSNPSLAPPANPQCAFLLKNAARVVSDQSLFLFFWGCSRCLARYEKVRQRWCTLSLRSSRKQSNLRALMKGICAIRFLKSVYSEQLLRKVTMIPSYPIPIPLSSKITSKAEHRNFLRIFFSPRRTFLVSETLPSRCQVLRPRDCIQASESRISLFIL